MHLPRPRNVPRQMQFMRVLHFMFHPTHVSFLISARQYSLAASGERVSRIARARAQHSVIETVPRAAQHTPRDSALECINQVVFAELFYCRGRVHANSRAACRRLDVSDLFRASVLRLVGKAFWCGKRVGSNWENMTLWEWMSFLGYRKNGGSCSTMGLRKSVTSRFDRVDK